MVLPAGSEGFLEDGAPGTGMTSEQSVKADRLWPTMANLDIAVRNFDCIRAWLAE